MADGLNQVRALRITELVQDYRRILTYLGTIRLNPSAEEYNEAGYMVLRQCMEQRQMLLEQPFHVTNENSGDDEWDKMQLRRIITDAAVRRFKAQWMYMRATAALRWVNARRVILQGRAPQAGHMPSLRQINNQLHSELSAITDQRVEATLRQLDNSAGKWLTEDPTLQQLRSLAAN